MAGVWTRVPACIKMFGPIKPNVNLIPHTGSLFIIKNCYIPFTGKAFSFSHVFFFALAALPPFQPDFAVRRWVLSVCVCAFRRRRWFWCNLYVARVVLRCWLISLHWFGYITLLHGYCVWVDYVSATSRVIFHCKHCYIYVLFVFCIFYIQKEN